MSDKIYNNKQEAQKACEEYVEKSATLRCELGIYEVCDDSCCDIIISVKYYDENKAVKTYHYN